MKRTKGCAVKEPAFHLRSRSLLTPLIGKGENRIMPNTLVSHEERMESRLYHGRMMWELIVDWGGSRREWERECG
jgi:hypothetical protein